VRETGVVAEADDDDDDDHEQLKAVAVAIAHAVLAAGKAGEVEAMSRAIAAGGIVYLVCAGLLVAALIVGRRTAVTTTT
jgi:hypothetical protein